MSSFGFVEYCFFVFWRELRSARHDPEERLFGAADESILVVCVDEEDAIVGVEGAEEGDAEDCRVVGFFYFAYCGGLFVVFDGGVGDFEFAVVEFFIGGGYVVHVAFEPVVEASDFVPLTEEAFVVEV